MTDPVQSPDGTDRTPAKGLRISDLSRISGVPVSTLRTWCVHGLLRPQVMPSGFRVFSQDDVRQVADIVRLRKLQGQSIAAIRAGLPRQPAGPATVPASTSSAPNEIGRRLRGLRLAAKMTLRDVAAKTGISASELASIEKTSLGLRLPEARALADLFGTNLTALMDEGAQGGRDVIFTGPEGGQILPVIGHGLRIEQRASGKDMMDCQCWYIDAGVHSHGAYQHDGEEFIYVLIGQFHLEIEGSGPRTLRQGESVYFKSTLRHSWRNPGPATTVLMWVNTPPTF